MASGTTKNLRQGRDEDTIGSQLALVLDDKPAEDDEKHRALATVAYRTFRCTRTREGVKFKIIVKVTTRVSNDGTFSYKMPRSKIYIKSGSTTTFFDQSHTHVLNFPGFVGFKNEIDFGDWAPLYGTNGGWLPLQADHLEGSFAVRVSIVKNNNDGLTAFNSPVSATTWLSCTRNVEDLVLGY